MKIVAVSTAIIVAIVISVLFLNSVEEVEVTLIQDQESPIILGVIPYLTRSALLEEMNPIAEYLSKTTGRPFKVRIATDYEGLAKMMEVGKAHIGWFSHISWGKLSKNRTWQILCRPVKNNSIVYRGNIVVKSDSPFMKLTDLKDKTFAFVDRNSGSGFVYPTKLLENMGIDPLTFFRKIVFTRSHDQSLDGVRKGVYDAAAVYDLLGKGDEELNSGAFRILAVTDWIPNDPLIAGPEISTKLKNDILRAMTEMNTSKAGEKTIKKLTQLRGTQKFLSEEQVQLVLKNAAPSGPKPEEAN
ncbi:MAG: hypothetical protein CVV64_09985 [Candidatus Wallbacteria bacterium HGW-Wallbacteria-1]|jgi:phosphate/phosphite/phosphonate ABC transporter binding protein|uniref:Phosphate/phosphite/phosphonate ABC transporter substrate-binding protein n=1 Tax=Candidatus Wallbacteria bacterium HGW-Wallbacteria-1 TaxID=2013854 RepID=A0A2N1PPM2_9BACT|nr:MAG: hypothetical protein CVV64_09985 [Candidatus Wallbacteria bacterium HGW-Wallbacteria-1]